MIAGPSVFICSECIKQYRAALENAGRAGSRHDRIAIPAIIHQALNAYVVEQEHAKKVLSVAVYNHYKRLASKPAAGGIELGKSNILLLGPTGTGKTLLARSLAAALQVPFAAADATALTQAGYVGEDVENMILSLLQNADHDVEKAKKGIIYIDEIDKIARRTATGTGRDISGEGVQQALLKLLEGTMAGVFPKAGKRRSQHELVQIDTTDVLFICGGTFAGLERIIKDRLVGKTVGFGAKSARAENTESGLLCRTEPADLIRYGFLPEFAGRLPIICPLHNLGRSAIVRILTEPKNAIVKQYQKLFSMEGVDLTFTEEALSVISAACLKKNSGARGLRAVMESFMLDIMFDLPDREDIAECIIDRDVVLDKGPPAFRYRAAQKHA